jgi:nucleotide-binding universal stress UspA family protein
MKHEHRFNRTPHYGGQPLLPSSDLRGRNGLASGISLQIFDEGPGPRAEAEGVRRDAAPTPRYRTVLVPVDGERFGEHALPLALGIARRAGAEVRVVHVHCPLQSAYRPDRFYYDDGLNALLRRDRRAYLDDLYRRLARVTSVRVTPVFTEGREVADSLREASAGADLVVMATHGRGPLGRLWFGSVADAIMRRLSIPLLLVRGYNAPADLTGDPLMRHVLIPLDGTDHAEQVLEPAMALGNLHGAGHTLLRVVPPAADSSSGYPGIAWHQRTAGPGQGKARDYLRRTAERLGGPAAGIHPWVVYDEGPVAGAILRYARSHAADLIALATRGRGGLTRLVRGSVADRVVRGASVPVLVYRAEGEPGGG